MVYHEYMKQAIVSWYKALREAPLWKKPIIIIMFPMLIPVAMALWKVEEKAEQAKERADQNEELRDDG